MYTDHTNLQYYWHPQQISQQVAQQIKELADFDIKLVHRPSSTNHVDHLSRRPDFDEGAHDNEDVLALPDQLFVNATAFLDLDNKIDEAQKQSSAEMDQIHATNLIEYKEGRYLHTGRPIVPNDAPLKRRLLARYHDHILSGHPGITNTLRAVLHDYWWPNCKGFVTNYVRGCHVCQTTKPNIMRPKPPLFPISAGHTLPFSTVSLNLITDLPKLEGNNSILTVVDQGCTKAAIFLPCQKTIGAVGVARLYATRIFPHYSAPQRLISD